MPPEISVIIILYNGISYILNCLESVKQDLECGAEIIIIDNASSDGGPELIARRFPDVQLVHNTRNLGFAAACNQGATLARGQILVFLNQDTRVEKGCLANLIQPLHENRDLGLTTARQLDLSNPSCVNRCGNRIHFSGLSSPGYSPQMNQPTAVDSISGAAFALRKTLWDSLGGFDPGYFMYYEDTDLSWRAWLLGLATCLPPNAVVHHNTSVTPPIHALYYTARNRPTLLLKTFKLPTLMLLLPGFLLAELID
jgi:GT2 family glycosyltransferase